MFKLPDGSLRIIVQGLARVRLDGLIASRPYLLRQRQRGAGELADRDRLEIDALQRNIKVNFQQIVSLSPLMSDDLQTLASNITEPGRAADFIASSLGTMSTAAKQEVLETLDVRARLDNAEPAAHQGARGPRARLEDPVAGPVRGRQEPARVLPARAAQGDPAGARRGRRPGASELDELREKIDAAGMPEDGARRRRCASSTGCRRCRPAAAEYTVSRTYLDWLVALPWAKRDRRGRSTCRRRATMLDAGPLRPREGQGAHPRVPRRAQARTRTMKGPILCFVGPPGVGKTSLGASRSPARSAASSCASRSAACATRPRSAATAAPTSARCPGGSSRACGGPGDATRSSCSTRSTSSGADFRGDPASALLEVLDPEQNNTFRDHYLDVPFDLSQVLFIATANVLDPIPPALRDRMEVHRAPRLHRGGEARRSPGGYLVPKPGRRARPDQPSSSASPTPALRTHHPRATPARPACATSSARSARSAARWRGEVAEGDRRAARRSTPAQSATSSSARRASSTTDRRSARRSRAWRPAWPGRRSAATSCSSRSSRMPRQGQR